MARMTKAQQKRMIRDIEGKVAKLYFNRMKYGDSNANVTIQDVKKIETYCKKWMMRLKN